jgi:polar amino acid transport system substrate-binding protein
MKQLIILLLFYFTADVLAQSPLYIGSSLVPPLSSPEQTGMLDRLAHEAFSRIGREVIINSLPSERALINANEGIDDGEILRIDGISKMYPNLLKVPEKTFDFEFVVLTKSKTMQISNWEDLAPYSVGLIKGWKILEHGTRNVSVINSVENAEDLLNMLQKDRVDLVIYERQEAKYLIRKNGMDDIRMLLPPLAAREMFMYLNKRHIELIPELTEALRQMKRDGSYDRITNDALSKW